MNPIEKSGLITVCLLSTLLWGLNFLWLSRDTRNPVWDMALHQTYALNYIGDKTSYPEENAKPWEKSGNYPPFVHLVIAFTFWVFHPSPHIAVLANIPATFILFWAVYELAKEFAGSRAGQWACLLTALTPYLVWFSRETVLDYWLSAWFAAALVVLRKTRNFQSHRWSLILGPILALGLLTKWFFAGFILAPLAYVAVKSRIWKDSARIVHFASALIISGLMAGLWYIPNLPQLVQYFRQNAEIGALEGEPPVFSFQSLIYYLRLLEGYQLFAILFVVLCFAGVFVWKNRLMSDGKFLIFSILGVWIVVTLLRTKDPRFTMPLIAPLAVISGTWIQSWEKTRLNGIIQAMLVILLGLQVYAANFGISWLPERIVLLQGYRGSFNWDWNLYLQDYFEVLGKPKREDWKQDEILRAIAHDSERRNISATLALVPDLPWFSDMNFNLYARMRGLKSQACHLKSAANGIHTFDGYNYVLTTDRGQGISWTTGASGSLNKIIADTPDGFHQIGKYALPNGDFARLYFMETMR